jgi:hypothetical protein
VHPGQINTWKKQFLKRASETFSRGKMKREQDHEEEKDLLNRQVGKLQVELDWLKKDREGKRVTPIYRGAIIRSRSSTN